MKIYKQIKKYTTTGTKIGDIFIDTSPGALIPINPYLPEN